MSSFPSWLKHSIPRGTASHSTAKLLKSCGVETVCHAARCPNRGECYSRRTATFLALGTSCTRHCNFCDIAYTPHPQTPDLKEPERIAKAIGILGLKHVVLTMVTRDDLADGGAAHIADIIKIAKAYYPDTTIEVLTSDFAGNKEALTTILEAPIDVFNHNLETVKRLTPRVRHKATYQQSLTVLENAADNAAAYIKSGLMVGLGETTEEVYEALEDLYRAGVKIVTIGQYLQPNPHSLAVQEYIHPKQFKNYQDFGYDLGFKMMVCGPFVRSSYHAEDFTKIEEKHGKAAF
ncbi:MAG: lipoyl synthase [Chlamydiota bacterium]